MKKSIFNSLKATCLGTATFALLAASPWANAGKERSMPGNPWLPSIIQNAGRKSIRDVRPFFRGD